ncbi:ABC transporter substrate-binding protein [Paenibacillus hodogayensis]|uniref:ABC transporter substrate-binding protein n=1 Tax=Paenibacillus hodogayensis TaxID=279208 RepID=A0ABV5W7P5_9BACL
MKVGSRKLWKSGLLSAAIGGLLAGCSGVALNKGGSGTSNREGEGMPAPISNEPVTIKIGATVSAALNNEVMFQETVVEPVRRKYPHISIEYIPMGGNNPVKSIDDWISSGNIPDIILHANGSMGELFTYDLMTDITPLVKQTGADLNRFDKAVLDSVRVASDAGWLVGIPFSQNFNALYYNKDIFDKFAVGYPSDGMTWDQVIELSKRLARNENGVQYSGLHPEWALRPAYPLALTIVDAKTGKSQLMNAQWKQVAELLQRIAAVPGNWDGKTNRVDFWGKKTIAMLATTNVFTSIEPEARKGFTYWDVAQYPSYTNQPGISGMVDAWVMIVAKTSKHKEQAMQVINAVTSDEAQLLASAKYAQLSTLANPAMKQQFGSQLDSLNMKEKNLAGIFKGRIVGAPKFSPYERQVRSPFEGNMMKVFSGEMDVNSALRDADERTNKLLEERNQ